MLGNMLKLPTNFFQIHQEFMGVKFALQLCDNYGFSQFQTDKVIEWSRWKLTKMANGASGYIGFSTNVNAVKTWEI